MRLLGVRAKVQTASEDINIQGKQAMPISILQKQNINDECPLMKLMHMTFHRCFDRLLGHEILM